MSRERGEEREEREESGRGKYRESTSHGQFLMDGSRTLHLHFVALYKQTILDVYMISNFTNNLSYMLLRWPELHRISAIQHRPKKK